MTVRARHDHMRGLDPVALAMIFNCDPLGLPPMVDVTAVGPGRVKPLVGTVLTIIGCELDTVGFWELKGGWGRAPGTTLMTSPDEARVRFAPAGDDVYDLVGYDIHGGLPLVRCCAAVVSS